ncbi:hypothetical protein MNEG_14791, partial [Monoraphidium neglectum]
MSVVRAAFDVSVRPYTLRKGDTLSSIAEKRGFTILQITSINHDVNPDKEGPEGRAVSGGEEARAEARPPHRAARPTGSARNGGSGRGGRGGCGGGDEAASHAVTTLFRGPRRQVKEGQTILLPASGLSSRDKEILEGIGSVY